LTQDVTVPATPEIVVIAAVTAPRHDVVLDRLHRDAETIPLERMIAGTDRTIVEVEAAAQKVLTATTIAT
jgi:hypothetical protein